MPDQSEREAIRVSILTPEVQGLREESRRIIEEVLMAECGPALPEMLTRQLQGRVETQLQGAGEYEAGRRAAYFVSPGRGDRELYEVDACSYRDSVGSSHNEVHLSLRYPTPSWQMSEDGKIEQTGPEYLGDHGLASIWLGEPGSSQPPQVNMEMGLMFQVEQALSASGIDFSPMENAVKQLQDQLGELDLKLYMGGYATERGLRENDQDEVGIILKALEGQRLTTDGLKAKRKEVFGDLG